MRWAQVEQLVELFLGGADRDKLDPILDACVAVYNSDLDEDGQVDFKGKAKAFVRTYQFLASILPYTNARLGEAVDLPELPDPEAAGADGGGPVEGHSRSHRHGQLPRRGQGDARSSRCPTRTRRSARCPPAAAARKPEPELDRLSNIIKAFNDQFGNIDWKDADRIRQVIAEEIPAKVAADKAYQNAMKNSDKAAARLEHDRALQKVVIDMLADHTELFKQFSDNPELQEVAGGHDLRRDLSAAGVGGGPRWAATSRWGA